MAQLHGHDAFLTSSSVRNSVSCNPINTGGAIRQLRIMEQIVRVRISCRVVKSSRKLGWCPRDEGAEIDSMSPIITAFPLYGERRTMKGTTKEMELPAESLAVPAFRC